jgi:hypothetical protein
MCRNASLPGDGEAEQAIQTHWRFAYDEKTFLDHVDLLSGPDCGIGCYSAFQCPTQRSFTAWSYFDLPTVSSSDDEVPWE